MIKFLEGQKNIDEPQTQVKEASCYGNLASCETPGQKCCRTTYERVCQQVGDNHVDVDAKFSVPKRALINITFTNKHTKGGQLQSPSKPSTIITKKNSFLQPGANKSSSDGEHDDSRPTDQKAGLPDG